MQKKIIILGATENQVSLILATKKYNLFTITCDNVPNNIGHRFSDFFLNISITDKENILKYMMSNNIRLIASTATELGLATTGYISDKLNLGMVSEKSINMLTNKKLFRKFQFDNGFSTPYFTNELDFIKDIEKINKPLFVVKPIDSSGSKGVKVIKRNISIDKLHETIEFAKSYSKLREIVIEELIHGTHHTIEGLIINNELAFSLITDKSLTGYPYLVPTGHTVPTSLNVNTQNQIMSQITKLIKLLEIKNSPFDADVIVCSTNVVYIIEFSPRIGGNNIPSIIKKSSNVDLCDIYVRLLLKKPNKITYETLKPTSGKIIYSKKNGTLPTFISFDEIKNLYNIELFYEPGDTILKFINSRFAIGRVILCEENVYILQKKIKTLKQYLNQFDLYI